MYPTSSKRCLLHLCGCGARFSGGRSGTTSLLLVSVFLFQMLGLNIESNLSPKTAWLQSYLGLSGGGVASVLKSFPAVLALNVENLEGKVRWVLHSCGRADGADGCPKFLALKCRGTWERRCDRYMYAGAFTVLNHRYFPSPIGLQ